MTVAEQLREEGRQEGRREGRQEGRREGRQEGMKLGRLEERGERIINTLSSYKKLRREGFLPEAKYKELAVPLEAELEQLRARK